MPAAGPDTGPEHPPGARTPQTKWQWALPGPDRAPTHCFAVDPQDTAGSERYEAMSRIYYRGARAAIVCYDLTDSSSFQRAKFWVNELQNFEENCRIYLCGTKSDLLEEDRRKRGVDFHDVQDYVDDELFQKVAEDFVHFTAFQVMTEEKGVDLGQKSGTYLYSCCHH
uniref:RAB24, member RAS oncogene family n=1 Tax=Apteryx owenii TaxID=8824 RepID=A0A8B9PTZ4_APTOW